MFQALSKNHQEKVKTWLNNVPDIKGSLDDLDWVNRHHKKIYNYINGTYTKKNSLKSHISTLGQVVKLLGNEKAYNKYSAESTAIQQQISKQNKEQQIDPERLDNFVCFEDIVKRRDEFRKRFEESPTDNKLNLSYLLLSLYTYQPPLRQDWKDVLITEKKPPVNTDQNYLWKQKNGKYTLFLNHDKVTHAYGKAQFDLPDELNKIIDRSLEKFPRKYVLSLIRNGEKPAGKQNFERLLIELFSPKRVTVDLLRSAYIIDKYNNKKMSLAKKEELAKKMRHSVSTAEENYNKLDVDCENDAPPIQPLPPMQKVEVPAPEPKKYFNLKEYMRKYREEHKEELKQRRAEYYAKNKDKILRRKIIWNLNMSHNTMQPSAESIKKYGIRYDDEKKLWV
jgi:hypothetical protein